MWYAPVVPASRPVHASLERPRHSVVVRITHWLTVLAFLALTVTGFEIVISHPRFYWGETGNINQAPLFSIPIPSSRGSVPTGYNYVMPDQNGWSRALHFQAAWLLLIVGFVYVAYGLLSGHFRRNLWPAGDRLRDVGAYAGRYLRGRFRTNDDTHSYNVLQRIAYLAVIFILFPLVILTGLSLSLAFNAACPIVVKLLGGHQTARTLHFFLTWALLGFLAVHVFMVVVNGLRRRMRAMTIGGSAPVESESVPAVEKHA